jgi:CBS domain-containing protein
MKVRDIMTQPAKTCHGYTDLATACRRMDESGSGMLVVLDGHGRVVGVVTDRDIAMAVGTGDDPAGQTIEDVMTSRVHTCTETETVHQALAHLSEGRVRRLPVLNSDGDLEGVLSIDDIILWAVHTGGVATEELTAALRRIVAPRHLRVEPDEAGR